MINTLLLWLWRKLTAYVEGALDPESAARAKAFKARADAVDARAKEAEAEAQKSEAQYQTSVNRRKEFDQLLEDSIAQEQESRARLLASVARVKEIEAQTAKLKREIDAKSDAEKVRVDL